MNKIYLTIGTNRFRSPVKGFTYRREPSGTVIGGWVSAKQDMLSNFIGEDWISFLKASESNMETLKDLTSVDEIFLSMINHLSST